MKYAANIFFLLFLFLSAHALPNTVSHIDTNAVITDYLNIPGPITFDARPLHLAWSSHPNKNIYIQEYIPNQESLARYSMMFFIQTFTDTLKIEQLLGVQLTLFEKRKKTDKIFNYQLFNNPRKTSYILDFVLSNDENATEIVEWNAYHYQYFNTRDGKKGIVLVGVSFREYENTISFLSSLTQLRKREIASLIKYPIPEIILP